MEPGNSRPPLNVYYQMRIKSRSDMENFLVCPVERRKKLGGLLEIPNLSWLETNRNHTQKKGAKPGNGSWNHENAATTQKRSKNGYKSADFLIQPSFSKWGKTRNGSHGSTSFLEFPTDSRNVYVTTWTRWGMCKKLDLQISRITCNRRNMLLAIWSM